jgi:hypothetical protein
LKKRNSAPKIIEEAPTEREVTEEVKKFWEMHVTKLQNSKDGRGFFQAYLW